MDLNLYLKRIKYNGDTHPTLDVLTRLQKAHLLNIAFENLDIHNKIRITPRRSYKKIIFQNRGGFCYELNGLFYELLRTLGFDARMISARVYEKQKGYGPEFDHMAIIVQISNIEYLVDVGFGEFAFQPLKIETGIEQKDPRGIFRIENFDGNCLVVAKQLPGKIFSPEYLFSTKKRQLTEFYRMCIYHQTSASSHFTQNRICSLPTLNGRITLSGNVLKVTADDIITERELKDEREFQEVLKLYFGIDFQFQTL